MKVDTEVLEKRLQFLKRVSKNAKVIYISNMLEPTGIDELIDVDQCGLRHDDACGWTNWNSL
ncbi:hypothetical protein C4900_13125 [Acidiferrobacter thiooxydans]|uniref:Uncharacterized protein n=1 Tax=Acidiferrobacter thiooxydans TaxID=163359 RepID=A0A368HEA9_9GAMM|nr:hypothetical protein C4900_13125 [Acidiferrobacter thiooxydans]